MGMLSEQPDVIITLQAGKSKPLVYGYEGSRIPLSLYAAVTDVRSGARYEELFAGLHNAIRECKPFQEE